MMDGYETVPQAARRLGLSEIWTRELARKGRFSPEARKVGRDWLIPKDAEVLPAREYKLSEEERAYYRERKRVSRERQRRANEG